MFRYQSPAIVNRCYVEHPALLPYLGSIGNYSQASFDTTGRKLRLPPFFGEVQEAPRISYESVSREPKCAAPGQTSDCTGSHLCHCCLPQIVAFSVRGPGVVQPDPVSAPVEWNITTCCSMSFASLNCFPFLRDEMASPLPLSNVLWH